MIYAFKLILLCVAGVKFIGYTNFTDAFMPIRRRGKWKKENGRSKIFQILSILINMIENACMNV